MKWEVSEKKRSPPQGLHDEDKQPTDSPVLSSSPHVGFAAGCWCGTVVELHHLLHLVPSKIISDIFILNCIISLLFFIRAGRYVEMNTLSSVWKSDTQPIYKSVFGFNMSIDPFLFSWSTVYSVLCLSFPPGWWLPGDLHQPRGDCNDRVSAFSVIRDLGFFGLYKVRDIIGVRCVCMDEYTHTRNWTLKAHV